MINILYLHNHSNISGGEQSLLNLWLNLDRNKYCPFLILPNNGIFKIEAEKIGIKVQLHRIRKIKLFNLMDIIKSILFFQKFCKIYNINIIHSYSPRNNLVAAIVGKCLNISVVWHERNLIFESEKDISKIFQFLPDCIICNSQSIARRFNKKSGISHKIKVIKNGVNTEKFKPNDSNISVQQDNKSKEKKIVGLISNLSKRKMPEYFIQLCPNILKEHPDTQFFIVGGEFSKSDQGRLTELKQKAISLGVADKIEFTGFRKDVADIIKLFDIGVSVTEKEACSRAILEMMSSGKPVVAFNSGGNSELIEDSVTGSLVEFGDILGMADSVNGLLKNNEKRNALGKYARYIAKTKFDIKMNTRKIEDVYSELIKIH